MNIPKPGEKRPIVSFPIAPEDEEAAEAEHAAMIAAQEKRARSLLGMDVVFETFTPEEKLSYLHSPERIAAFERITTTTNPRKAKAEQKRSIVSEVLKKHLISETLLVESRVVHLGSGIDVEYPLALGARTIEMIDPILADPAIVKELLLSIATLTRKQPVTQADGSIEFPFDFGKGPEVVTLYLRGNAYLPNTDTTKTSYLPADPEEIGMILCFAAQGPNGRVVIGEDLKSNLTEGGIILMEREVITRNNATGEETTVEVGRREE